MVTDAHISIRIIFITIIVCYRFILLTKRYNNKTITKKIIFARAIYETGWPKYLFALIPQTNHLYETRLLEDVPTFHRRTDVFKYSFFPSAIVEWNRLERKIWQYLKIGRPTPRPV